MLAAIFSIFMAAGRFAYDLEKLSDESAVDFVMVQLRKMFPHAPEPVSSLFLHISATCSLSNQQWLI